MNDQQEARDIVAVWMTQSGLPLGKLDAIANALITASDNGLIKSLEPEARKLLGQAVGEFESSNEGE